MAKRIAWAVVIFLLCLIPAFVWAEIWRDAIQYKFDPRIYTLLRGAAFLVATLGTLVYWIRPGSRRLILAAAIFFSCLAFANGLSDFLSDIFFGSKWERTRLHAIAYDAAAVLLSGVSAWIYWVKPGSSKGRWAKRAAATAVVLLWGTAAAASILAGLVIIAAMVAGGSLYESQRAYMLSPQGAARRAQLAGEIAQHVNGLSYARGKGETVLFGIVFHDATRREPKSHCGFRYTEVVKESRKTVYTDGGDLGDFDVDATHFDPARSRLVVEMQGGTKVFVGMRGEALSMNFRQLMRLCGASGGSIY